MAPMGNLKLEEWIFDWVPNNALQRSSDGAAFANLLKNVAMNDRRRKEINKKKKKKTKDEMCTEIYRRFNKTSLWLFDSLE